jgi:ankyrin repeat protein
LIWATWYGHAGIVRLLLDRGAKIDIADKVSYSTMAVQSV